MTYLIFQDFYKKLYKIFIPSDNFQLFFNKYYLFGRYNMVIIYFFISIIVLLLILQVKILKKYRYLNAKEKSLVASVTHDLKNPTRAQINMLNLLLKGYFGALNPKQQEMIKLACGSSKYVSNLVGTILTGYQAETRILKLNITKFDLRDVIEDVCNINRYLARDKGQKFVINCRVNVGYIYADKLQIERVIYNLVSNAIKYGNRNSKIIITLKRLNNEIKFSIANKSNPIPKKELKYIFNKFTKTRTSYLASDSCGLGLYIAKNIINLHHGKMYARSLADGTCIFGFRLKSVQNDIIKTS